MRLLLINGLSGAFWRATAIGREPKRQQADLDFWTSEEHVIGAEKRKAALKSCVGSSNHSVAIEHAEIIDRALFHVLQQGLVILIGGPGTQLVPPYCVGAPEIT